MKKTIWVFPMAGNGTRTRRLGEFKPFIPILGRKMIGWCLSSIRRHIAANDELVFITTREFDRRYRFRFEIETVLRELHLGNTHHIRLADRTPQGPAASVHQARDIISVSAPCMVVNCDQYIDFPWRPLNKYQAILPVFTDTGNTKSYLVFDDDTVASITEKRNRSNVASAGVYGVGSGLDLVWALETQFEHKETVKGEYFVGPALNRLIEKGYKMTAVPCHVKYDLGSPSGIESFQSFITNLKEILVAGDCVESSLGKYSP